MTKTTSITCALALGASLFALPAFAENQYFESYEAYDSFVNEMLQSKDFSTLARRIGGQGSYAEGQLDSLTQQFNQIYNTDFVGHTVFKKELGGGVTREGRAFWTDDDKMLFFSAALLERDGGITVLTFDMSGNPKAVLDQF